MINMKRFWMYRDRIVRFVSVLLKPNTSGSEVVFLLDSFTLSLCANMLMPRGHRNDT